MMCTVLVPTAYTPLAWTEERVAEIIQACQGQFDTAPVWDIEKYVADFGYDTVADATVAGIDQRLLQNYEARQCPLSSGACG